MPTSCQVRNSRSHAPRPRFGKNCPFHSLREGWYTDYLGQRFFVESRSVQIGMDRSEVQSEQEARRNGHYERQHSVGSGDPRARAANLY